jgi:hypothetical protein
VVLRFFNWLAASHQLSWPWHLFTAGVQFTSMIGVAQDTMVLLLLRTASQGLEAQSCRDRRVWPIAVVTGEQAQQLASCTAATLK